MKMLLIGLMLLGLAAPVHSNDLCDAIGSAAESSMSARQVGVSKSVLEEIMRDASTTRQERQIMQMMIDRAFETPRHSTESARNSEARRFGLLWEAACHQLLRDQ